jgi:hypothetical protein
MYCFLNIRKPKLDDLVLLSRQSHRNYFSPRGEKDVSSAIIAGHIIPNEAERAAIDIVENEKPGYGSSVFQPTACGSEPGTLI